MWTIYPDSERNAEGLDPIYALEAKFSLLQAIAQSQLGADKLVSEGLFEILGRCTFIGARPDGAEAVAGMLHTCSFSRKILARR